MPLLLGNNGFDLLMWDLTTKSNNCQRYAIYVNLVKYLLRTLIKLIFALNLLKFIYLPSSEGIKQSTKYYGSVEYTVITIEADERAPLLDDRILWPDKYKNNNKNIRNTENWSPKCYLSSWSINESNQSNNSTCSAAGTKSFKSHFMEFKVLAILLMLIVAISIATYLLLIESRLPSITSSLELVSHAIWSNKTMAKYKHLQYNNVDHIILILVGNQSCDTTGECLKLLIAMQNNEDLPYNFLIAGDGQVYEVRGWKYQSSIKGIPQERSLAIGIIYKFQHSSYSTIILRTIKSLIQQSSKRHMINSKYYIYGLFRNVFDPAVGKDLFTEIMKWPQFEGFFNDSELMILSTESKLS